MRLPEPVRDWKEPDRDDIETELVLPMLLPNLASLLAHCAFSCDPKRG